jgi:drug/metabolite transporter (DMT)-like permease
VSRESQVETPPSHNSRLTTHDSRHIFQPDTPRRGPAVVAMFLAGLLFAVMGIAAKAIGLPVAGRPLPASEVALFRFFFGVLVMLPLHGRRGIDLPGRDRRGLAMRGIYGGFAVCLYFLSLQHTSLTHAVLLNYTSLIFAPLFALFALREPISPRAALAITVALFGILLITRPEVGALRAGDLFGLLSGIMAGAAITEVRRLRQTESAWSIFFYLSLVGVPIALLACLFEHPAWPAWNGWLLLLGMAAASVVAQILMTYGYKYVRTTEGTLMTLSQIVYNALAGVFLFGEVLTAATLLGGALVLGAALWLSAVGQGK